MKIDYNVKVLLAVFAFIASVGFAIAGICIPPPGEISGSLLILISQFLVFTCTLIGLNLKIDLLNKQFEATHQLEKSSNKDDIDKIKQIIKEQDEKEVES